MGDLIMINEWLICWLWILKSNHTLFKYGFQKSIYNSMTQYSIHFIRMSHLYVMWCHIWRPTKLDHTNNEFGHVNAKISLLISIDKCNMMLFTSITICTWILFNWQEVSIDIFICHVIISSLQYLTLQK